MVRRHKPAEGQGNLFSNDEHRFPMGVATEAEQIKGPAFRAGRFSALRIAQALTTGEPIPGLPERDIVEQIKCPYKLRRVLQLLINGNPPTAHEKKQGACEILNSLDPDQVDVHEAALQLQQLFAHKN